MTLRPHKHCIRHRTETEASEVCGCFYCLSTFAPSHIVAWTDDGQTALSQGVRWMRPSGRRRVCQSRTSPFTFPARLPALRAGPPTGSAAGSGCPTLRSSERETLTSSPAWRPECIACAGPIPYACHPGRGATRRRRHFPHSREGRAAKSLIPPGILLQCLLSSRKSCFLPLRSDRDQAASGNLLTRRRR